MRNLWRLWAVPQEGRNGQQKHFVREEDSLPLLQTPSLTSAILDL